MSTGFVYHTDFLDHDTGRHPERRERVAATQAYLEKLSWFESLVQLTPQPAERRWIETIHSGEYLARAENACRNGLPYLDTMDVAISRKSFEVATLAAGTALALGDQVMSGAITNGFGLVRPPGHHAENTMALGFCLFNNVAILARYLQLQHGVEKVLILDWDVHHGNGTQHSFEEDPSVMYVSLHQYPFYPGTGARSETGVGRGEGATINCPMPAGASDEDYQAAFSEMILPRVNAFGPDVVVLSAGFDAHRRDPLAEIQLSTECFAWMSERMMEVADRHAGGRIISMLEGGYDLEALSHCVASHLRVLSRQTD